MGRGHDADIRVTDISVSRLHAKINKSPTTGEYFVEDNKSKFGTLVQVRKPLLLQKNRTNYVQMGRTMLQLRIDDTNLIEQSYKQSSTATCCQAFLCCKKKETEPKLRREERPEFYPREWDPDQSQSKEELDESRMQNTQIVEQTKDDELSPSMNNENDLEPQNLPADLYADEQNQQPQPPQLDDGDEGVVQPGNLGSPAAAQPQNSDSGALRPVPEQPLEEEWQNSVIREETKS